MLRYWADSKLGDIFIDEMLKGMIIIIDILKLMRITRLRISF